MCQWCLSEEHGSDKCPLVKHREYYASGALRQIEFYDRLEAHWEPPAALTLEELKRIGSTMPGPAE